MSDVDEIKSPFLRKNIEERGIIDDLVTDLLIVERYLRRPELTDSVAALMLRAAIKDHPLEVEIVSRELSIGRAITEPEMDELRCSLSAFRGLRAAKDRTPQCVRAVCISAALILHHQLEADRAGYKDRRLQLRDLCLPQQRATCRSRHCLWRPPIEYESRMVDSPMGNRALTVGFGTGVMTRS